MQLAIAHGAVVLNDRLLGLSLCLVLGVCMLCTCRLAGSSTEWHYPTTASIAALERDECFANSDNA